jgi:multiple sugar transport system substrate-binding protein
MLRGVRAAPIRPLALLLSAALAAAACGRGAEPGVTTIEFWALGREGEAVRALVPEFERAHPDVRVRVQQIPWSAAHEKLLTAWVGGALPDAFQLGVTWIAEFASVGALAPLDARIAASAALPRDDFFPGLLEATRYAGATYAVPWYADTRLFFYRGDLLGVDAAAAPRSWDEWRAALAPLRGRLGPGAAPLFAPLGEWELPVILALQRGAGLLRDDARFGDFQSPAFRDAFAFYLSLYADGLAARDGAAQVANLHQDFAAGRFVAFVTGPWNLGELARRLPPELEPRWGTAPLPAQRAGDAPGVSLAGGAGLALAAGSPRQDAAFAWVEFLAQPAQQLAFQRLSGDLPARRSAWDDAALAGDARARAFRVQLEHLRALPAVPEWEQIASRIARHAEAAVRGSATPDAALAALDADADRILEKRRWLLARGAPR